MNKRPFTAEDRQNLFDRIDSISSLERLCLGYAHGKATSSEIVSEVLSALATIALADKRLVLAALAINPDMPAANLIKAARRMQSALVDDSGDEPHLSIPADLAEEPDNFIAAYAALEEALANVGRAS